MKSAAIRTSIDLPRDLHRRLHEAAAQRGCSARKLILVGIERAVDETLSAGCRTADLVRPGERALSTTEMTDEVIKRIVRSS